MCDLGSIKFNTMEVNTVLAEKYFKEKSNHFKSITELESVLEQGQTDFDGYNTITFSTSPDEKIYENFMYRPRETLSTEGGHFLRQKLLKLTELIKKNAELFGQIEYLVRKKNVKEVKEFDILLITHNLSYLGYMSPHFLKYECDNNTNNIKMNANTPLANIAFVAQLILNNEKVRIFPTRETAAVTCLFVELCHKCDLNSIEVVLMEEEELEKMNLNFVDMANVSTITKGCVGVITERSDLDSAVDVFLNTTTNYPWKLSQIFVQESIYDRFKKAMSWKTGLVSDSTNHLKANNQLCDNVFEYAGKTILVDYAGASESIGKNNIRVEAYRTTKELIVLVTKYEALYLSLWSSDLSEANEIAHKVRSSIVWINNYGIFDGPLRCSQAIYGQLFNQDKYQYKVKKGFMSKQVNWSKKTLEERRRFLYDAGMQCLGNETKYCDDIHSLITALCQLKAEDFVVVENKRMCSVLSIPNSEIFVISLNEKNVDVLAKLLTSGAGIVINDDDETEEHFLQELSPEIPVALLRCQTNNECVSANKPKYHTKVVWTDFGTTFAN